MVRENIVKKPVRTYQVISKSIKFTIRTALMETTVQALSFRDGACALQFDDISGMMMLMIYFINVQSKTYDYKNTSLKQQSLK